MSNTYRNVYTVPLVFSGCEFAPGDLIPATVDPAQLAYFASVGAVTPTTAPDAALPSAASGHVSEPDAPGASAAPATPEEA